MRRYFFILILLFFLCSVAKTETVYKWEDCVRIAKENHQDLIASREKIKQAEINKVIVRSNMFPSVNGSLGKQFKEDSPGTYNVSGSLLLFNGKTRNEIRKSKDNISLSRYSYDVTSSQVRRELRIAFIYFLKAQENIVLTKKIYERRKKQSELVKLRYEAGREHKGSLMTAEALFEQANFDVNKSLRDISLAYRRLIKALGIDIETAEKIDKVKGDFDIKYDFSKEENFEEIINKHPLLYISRIGKGIAEYNLKISKSELLPNISASARKSGYLEDTSREEEDITTSVNLSIPIFQGGRTVGGIRKSRYEFKQKQAEYTKEISNVLYSLEDKWIAFQNAVESINLQKKFYDAAYARATIAEAQYSSGLLSFDDWIVIEDSLVNAQKSLLNVKADALIAETEWIYAKGGTLEND